MKEVDYLCRWGTGLDFVNRVFFMVELDSAFKSRAKLERLEFSTGGVPNAHCERSKEPTS